MLFTRPRCGVRWLVFLLALGCARLDGDPRDWDGDGWPASADCNDRDRSIHPEADEVYYDGIDQNCDGRSDWDADEDGYDSTSYGGPDCDDTDPEVTGADLDGDLVSSCEGDCDDLRADVYPGAPKICGDGVDNDCDGLGECPISGAVDVHEVDAMRILGDPDDPQVGTRVQTGDLNGDGFPDVAVSRTTTSWIVMGPIVEDVRLGIDGSALVEGGFTLMSDVDDDGNDEVLVLRRAGYDGVAMVFDPPLAATLDENNASSVIRWWSNSEFATGDFDGDGIVDFITGGRYSADPGPGGEDLSYGAAAIHLGPIVGDLDPDEAVTLLLGEPGESVFGFNVAADPDVTGDGLADLLVTGATGSDAAYVVSMPHTRTSMLEADVRWDISPGPDEFHGVGDVDGDGYRDVAALLEAYEVALVTGPITANTDISLPDIALERTRGSSFIYITELGDHDGDGIDDVCIATPFGSLDQDWGQAWLVLGPLPPQGELDAVAHAFLRGGEESGNLFGLGCAGVDLNQDGLQDLLIGEPNSLDATGTLQGSVWILPGGGTF